MFAQNLRAVRILGRIGEIRLLADTSISAIELQDGENSRFGSGGGKLGPKEGGNHVRCRNAMQVLHGILSLAGRRTARLALRVGLGWAELDGSLVVCYRLPVSPA